MGDELFQCEVGKVIVGRWKVVQKLGAGGCGAVYLVNDLQNKYKQAALKVERNDENSVIKLEAEVMRRLGDAKGVIRMLQAGKRDKYNFLVMTLCWKDMYAVMKGLDKPFTESTMLRIGIHALYSIKQLHEVGFVHRDVKPGNFMVGAQGRDRQTVFMIDYGMVRSFVTRSGDDVKLRKARKGILLRGTLRYCSIAVHKRLEQGRVDDLWSLLFMLIELFNGLPWRGTTVEKDIQNMKETLGDEVIYRDCPPEWCEMSKYLKTLNYADRPDYYKIYSLFAQAMKNANASFFDPLDWEKEGDDPMHTCLPLSEREKKTKKSIPKVELEWKMFPTTHPDRFKENILGI